MKSLKENNLCIYIMSIGDMPDELSRYIQDFLRPDLVKVKQQKQLKILHKKLKSFQYCDCDGCCGCPCPDVIQRLDDYKDSEVFFVTTNFNFKRLGFKNFNKSFMIWYEIASQEITAPPELEWDIGKMYSVIGTANNDFDFWRTDYERMFDDFIVWKSDLVKNKYKYLKSLNIH